MNFRYARHTTDLQNITNFYTDVVGLSILGSFENHDGCDGIFFRVFRKGIGIEFTYRKINHITHLMKMTLVFYYSEIEWVAFKKVGNV
ncbi:MAG: hypothetical protein IPN79_20030 [Saprospiraceae bacterium]|nr:hypothetical protein [Saprospiraceae bacterium]